MSKTNFLVFLNTYADSNPSNNPSLSNFKWTREIDGIPSSDAVSQAFELAPGESKTLFNGTRTLLQDGTTQYGIALKPLSSNTYVLTATSGTLPNFRTPRSTGANATTAVTITLNGPLATFSSPASAAANFAAFTGQVAGMTTNVTITADNAGTAGNSVLLPFDGVVDITAAILAWNTAHPSNTVTLTSGNGAQVPNNATSIALSGGAAAVVGFNFAAVQIGDLARLGNVFNALNQGEFKIIAKTTTSFTVENESAAAEGPIVLGSGFASQVQIYSAAGVQKGDTIVISGGFSVVTQNSYKITDVAANYLEFYSTDILPTESNIQTQAIAAYSSAKNLIYLESDQKAAITINGADITRMEPFIINNSVKPGVFMLKATVYSLSVQNTSLNSASLFLACVE